MQQDDQSPYIFPKKVDRDRIAKYTYYDGLYNGDHFEAFSIKGEQSFSTQYNKLRYVVANYAGLMSHIMADMLFGENLVIDCDSEENQEFIDAVVEENQLKNQLYESALANSRRGDSLFKMRIGQRNPKVVTSKPTIIIEEISPSIYFPVLEDSGARYSPTEEVLAWPFKQGENTYLHKETHLPGYIFHEIYSYDPKTYKLGVKLNSVDFGFPEQEETGVDRPLIFHTPNFRDGNGFWGTSDYKGLESLFFAINNRITKMDNILDKHSDPILAVPPGVLDEEGQIKKESLGMFEVANDNPGFNKPEYIIWNANLDSAEKQVDKLIELLYTMSEISPTSVGVDGGDGGRAESGRALKFRLLASIRKRNRKIRYYDTVIKEMLETALALSIKHNVTVKDKKAKDVEQPSLDWGDGVINDEVEQTDTEIKRVEAGLSSRADSIARLDGLTPDEAKDKVKEIDEESGPDLTQGLLAGVNNDQNQNVGNSAGAAGAANSGNVPPNQQGNQGNSQQPNRSGAQSKAPAKQPPKQPVKKK